jgi:hypothetical protein
MAPPRLLECIPRLPFGRAFQLPQPLHRKTTRIIVNELAVVLARPDSVSRIATLRRRHARIEAGASGRRGSDVRSNPNTHGFVVAAPGPACLLTAHRAHVVDALGK